MTEKRFTWEYSNYDSTGEIHDWSRSYNACLITDYLQKWELEEWCDELNKIVDENNQLRKENEQLKQQIKHSQKRTAIISGWLHDEGNLTLKKYEEILDYCYQQYKKEVLND